MFIDVNAREIVYHPDDASLPEGERRFIRIRKQLNQAQRGAVMDAALHMDLSGGEATQTVAVGSFSYELLKQYVTDWGGGNFPKFDAALIVNLDADDPLVKAAAERAAELWKAGQKTDPKG